MRGNYLKRLILACLLVVFFCGCVTAAYTYVEKIRLTEEEWKRNHLLVLEQMRDKVDLKLATVMNAILNLRARPELIDYASSKGVTPYINTKAFQALGTYIDAYLPGAYQIDIFKTDAPVVITRKYTIDMGRYMQDLGIMQEPALEQLRERSKGKRLYIDNLAEWRVESGDYDSKPRRVHFTVVVNDNRYDQICFLVAMNIEDLFPKDGKDGERYAIMMGEELFAESHPYVDSPAMNMENYTAGSRTFPQWSYTYSAQMPSFHSIELFQTIVVALTTIAAGAIFAILIAFRTYRPVGRMIREVKELAPEKSDQDKSGDEFHVIQSITNTMYRKNQELSSKLHEFRQPMREKLLRDLILGMLSKEDALRELQLLQMDGLASSPMSVALLHEFDETGLSLIDQSIVDGIEQIVMELSGEMEFIRMDNNRQVLLIFNSSYESSTAMLQAMINDVHQSHPVRLTVSAGIAVAGVLDAVISYHSAVRVLEQLRPMNRKSLLTIADLHDGKHTEYYYPLDLEKELVHSALGQNENEVIHIIESLLRGAAFTTMDSAAYVQFTYSIQSTLQRITQQLNVQLADIFEEMPFMTLQQCATQEEVSQELLAMFRKVMEVADEKNKSLDQMLSANMAEYIHTHYHRDISLTDLAQHMKMSPSYISSIFKVYHGDNYKDYLNNYRVEQAKLLIEQGEDKVNVISARVGCNNVNTFIRIFKKAEGVSPGQYIASRNRGTI